VPGRVGWDLDDWIADTLGSLFGGVVARWVVPRLAAVRR